MLNYWPVSIFLSSVMCHSFRSTVRMLIFVRENIWDECTRKSALSFDSMPDSCVECANDSEN